MSTRSRCLIAALLLTLTLAGGVAARMASGPGGALAGKEPAPGSGLQFRAGESGPVSFTGRLDRASLLAGGDGLVNMELILRGDRQPGVVPVRVPTDLVVVLDRSGSMQGEPMAHALASVRQLISSLSAEDRFSLVSYASGASVTIPLAGASAADRREWLATLSRIRVGGGTNMASGIDMAITVVERFRQKGRVPRMILLSDGHANEGDHSLEGLVNRAARVVAGEYVLSTVGVGEGFDEGLMTALADAGTGSFYYVRRSQELGEIFADEFASARETLASALQVEIRTAPGVEVLSAAGYPLESMAGGVRFRPGALFAGQERRIWVALRVPVGEVEALPGGAMTLGQFALAYSLAGKRQVLRFSQTPTIALAKGEADFLAQLDRQGWEQSVAEEEFGELKQSVAAAVRGGKREEALGRLRSFEAKQQSLNRHVKSKKVDEVLSSVKEMEDAVAEAFEANSPAAKNRLSKQYSAEGYDSRRQGAKR